MLVQDLKHISQIDEEITQLQVQLIELFNKRSSILVKDPNQKPQDSASFELYNKLFGIWSKYGIVLPDYAKLSKKLEKALKLKKDWSDQNLLLQNKMEVLIVPPLAKTGLPVKPALRQKQRLLAGSDVVDAAVTIPRGLNTWRVLLVYTAPSGIHMGTEKEFFANKAYLIDEVDTRALGMQEYAALTLQLSQPIDNSTWTSLLKPAKKATDKGQIIYVGCRHSRYRFDVNDMYGAFEDDRFRPAVEVKS